MKKLIAQSKQQLQLQNLTLIFVVRLFDFGLKHSTFFLLFTYTHTPHPAPTNSNPPNPTPTRPLPISQIIQNLHKHSSRVFHTDKLLPTLSLSIFISLCLTHSQTTSCFYLSISHSISVSRFHFSHNLRQTNWFSLSLSFFLSHPNSHSRQPLVGKYSFFLISLTQKHCQLTTLLTNVLSILLLICLSFSTSLFLFVLFISMVRYSTNPPY